MSEPLHLLRIAAIDRPGTIETIAAAFSSRGISLETLCAVRGTTPTAIGQGISLAYRSSDSRHDLMIRILQRMACVKSVTDVPSDSSPTFLPCHSI
jgi:acetolactate synthase small subunit